MIDSNPFPSENKEFLTITILIQLVELLYQLKNTQLSKNELI